jgi:hypothetical protein
VIYEPTGGLRARADYAFGLARLATARAPSAPLVVLDEIERTATVLDRVGAPLRRVVMPTEIGPHALFSTVVDGKPVVGVVLAHPLRVVSF